MYGAIVQQFSKMLGNLDGFLAKAEAYAADRGFPADNYLQARLAPDMFPLVRQVQVATDVCKITAARVANVAPPSFPDTESSIADLRARVARTRAFVAELDLESAVAQDGERRVPAGFPPEKTMRLHDYVVVRQLANFHFHVVTAYDLLRAGGVPIGKADFLGALPME
jgi:hypothetical protein